MFLHVSVYNDHGRRRNICECVNISCKCTYCTFFCVYSCTTRVCVYARTYEQCNVCVCMCTCKSCIKQMCMYVSKVKRVPMRPVLTVANKDVGETCRGYDALNAEKNQANFFFVCACFCAWCVFSLASFAALYVPTERLRGKKCIEPTSILANTPQQQSWMCLWPGPLHPSNVPWPACCRVQSVNNRVRRATTEIGPFGGQASKHHSVEEQAWSFLAEYVVLGEN